MSMITVSLCVALSLFVFPSEGAKFNEEKEIVLNTRQAISCSQDSDCYPDNITVIPSALVECESSICVCNQCFSRQDDGRCGLTYPDCYIFDTASLQCDDQRDHQLVAFLLSFFLSGVGAANFYIGQDGLAAGQLVLFIIVVLLPICAACIPCCLICCIAGDEAKGSIFAICFFVIMFVIIFAGSLAMFAWWIADIVIFATNDRDSGNGCPLKGWDE